MNILKYLIAETINDNDTEEFIEFGHTREVNHETVADNVFQAFAALSNRCVEVGSREISNSISVFSQSDIVLAEGVFANGTLTAHLDTVH